MHRTLILGGPGAGKTTSLMGVLEREIANGVHPERIAFVSFTKKAVEEAKTRASEQLRIPKPRFPWFRTLHSLAWRETGMDKEQLFGWKARQRFIEMTGYEITGDTLQDEEFRELGDGDQLLQLTDLARNTQRTLEEIHETAETDFSLHELERFHDAYKGFKAAAELKDFTDILQDCVSWGREIDVEVAIIDEAQDLTPLQWAVAERAFPNAERTYYAGDDDQAIYTWNGADVNKFLGLDVDQQIVLPKSWRLPRKIFDLSQQIVKRISRRYSKDMGCRDEDGEIHSVADLDFVNWETPGSWMVLARNRHHLKDVKADLREEGILYSDKTGKSVVEKEIYAIRSRAVLEQGGAISGSDMIRLRKMMELPFLNMSPRQHFTADDVGIKFTPGVTWFEDMVGIPEERRIYYGSIVRRGQEKMLAQPKVHLNTIHSTKGGEADNVLIMQDTSKDLHNDDEHRVFYVGVTRARHRLFILDPQGANSYPIT